MKKTVVIIFCLIFAGVFIVAISQAENDKIIRAVKTETTLVIDGKLDEPCWQKANKVSDFVQSEPEEGGKPSEMTTVYLLYDEKKLYVGFECFQSVELQASATRRDSHFFNDDYVEVFLDTFHDKRNCYAFGLNLLGAQIDARIANEGSNQRGHGGDTSWDCGWDGQAARGEDKWTAEFAIPFCELRFKNKPDSVWGINFMRNIERSEEEDSWSDIGDNRYKVSLYGTLCDLPVSELVTSRPLELKPYITVKPQVTRTNDSCSGRVCSIRQYEWEVFEKDRADIGLDIRYPFSVITLDMTLNPDFAQVEADPSEINLSDVPRRLPEKRSFFQEGAELFSTPIDIFYTRSIEDPLVGVKAAGKLGAYNLALLDTQTSDNEDPDDDDEFGKAGRNFSVFRLQRDIGKSTTIGILAVNKQNKNSYNRAAGIDTQISLGEDFGMSGQYAYTHSPDIGSDSDAFSVGLGGEIGDLFLRLSYRDIGADFSAESGFVPDSRLDRRGGDVDMGYRRQFQDSWLKRLGGGIEYGRLYDHAGELTNESREIGLNISFWDFFFSPGFNWYYHPVEDDDTGQVTYYTDETFGFFGGWFPPKWVSLFTRMSVGKREGEDSFFIGPSLSLKPTDELALRFEHQRSEHGDDLKIINNLTVDYRFTQRMNLRTSCEVTNDDERYIFALYSWEFRPESNLFLVYTQNRDPEEDYTTEHTFFMKIAYLFKWKPLD